MSGMVDRLITLAFGVGVGALIIKNAGNVNTLTQGTVSSVTSLVSGIANA